MSIWKTLCEIFDKERAVLNKGKTNKQALTFKLKSNLLFLADALNNNIKRAKIIEQLEHKVFDLSIDKGF